MMIVDRLYAAIANDAAELNALRAELRDLKRRAKEARALLRCINSGQFHTAAMVVAALRTLDVREPLPLKPLPKKGRK